MIPQVTSPKKSRPLLELDNLLCASIAAAETAAKQRPENARDFSAILALLWSARDEIDLIVARPAPQAPKPHLVAH